MADTVERETLSLKGYADFVEKVRKIAVIRDLTIPDVLDRFALPAIDREHKKAVREEYAAEFGNPGA